MGWIIYTLEVYLYIWSFLQVRCTWSIHSLCAPSSSLGWSSNQIFKKDYFERILIFRDEWGSDLGACSFYITDKLKPDRINDKKFVIKKIFSAISKNLNWEILTKNLVTFKRWDGVKGWKILILWVFTERTERYDF